MKKKYIDIHTHRISENEDVFSIYNYPIKEQAIVNKDQPVSVGIHPWYVDKKNKLSIEKVESLAENESTWAIGECGLDRIVAKPMIFQMEVFIQQIILSEKVKKPLIIHCVRAFPEIVMLKNKYNAKQSWIVHGFNSNEHSIHQLKSHDIYVSYGSQLTSSNRIRDIFSRMPDDKYFLETDDQSSVSIEEVYAQAASIKGLNIDDLINQQRDNFFKCFNKSIDI